MEERIRGNLDAPEGEGGVTRPLISLPMRPARAAFFTVGPNPVDRVYNLHKCSAGASVRRTEELASV